VSENSLHLPDSSGRRGGLYRHRVYSKYSEMKGYDGS